MNSKRKFLILKLSAAVLSFLILAPGISAAQESPLNDQGEIAIKYFALLEGRLVFSYQKGKASDLWVLDFGKLSVAPLVKDEGKAESPAWSPDGKKVAFAMDIGSNKEIYLVNYDGSNLQRLTNTPGDDDDPSWSPDGKRIAFSSQRLSKNRNIFVMDADGSRVSQLTDSSKENTCPRWSPRGSELLFTTNAYWPGLDIILFDLKTKRQKVLTSGSRTFLRPFWSPDGSSFLFAYASAEDTGIWKLTKGEKNPVPIITRTGRNLDPVWSDDGKRIFFSGEVSAGNNIFALYAYDIALGQTSQITESAGSVRQASWTPFPALDSIVQRIVNKPADKEQAPANKTPNGQKTNKE